MRRHSEGLRGTLLPFTLWSIACWILLIWHVAGTTHDGVGVRDWLLIVGGTTQVDDSAVKLCVVVWNLLFLAGIAWLPLAIARNAAAPFVALIGLGGALLIEPAMRSAFYLGVTGEGTSIWTFNLSNSGFSFFRILLIVEIAVAFIALMAIYRLLFRSRRACHVFFQPSDA